MTRSILILNAGSSTLKIAIMENGKTSPPKVLYKKTLPYNKKIPKISIPKKYSITQISKVAHRVVHGGEKYTEPTRITPQVLNDLEKLSDLAPLHNPRSIAIIKAAQKLFPHVPHYAIFDTAFYKTLPKKAFLYAIPLSYYEKYKIRRYGFHGINHEYLTIETIKRLKKINTKIITCHLGHGCSITASKNGRAIDTSMGFTPLEGIPMATRSGDLDPAIIDYLQKKLKKSSAEILKILNNESGLKGLCKENDMKKILARAALNDASSILAIEIFCYRVAKTIGSYIAALNGLDALTFSGGIGENAPAIRKKILSYFARLKYLDFKTFVIPANEELMMAKAIQ